MRARRDTQRPFLERTEAEWRALGVPERRIPALSALRLLAGTVLARQGALRPDEAARLRRIATGTETHPRIDMDRARLLLAHHDGTARCADG